MRLRNVRGSRETIAADDCVLHDPAEQRAQKGHWHELFGNDHPIHIEVGMGKGKFIMTLAQQNPDINYIGIEKYSSVLVRALEKYHTYGGDNIFFLRMDAEDITDIFAENEVGRIYLNFSDPWPKDRHAKRRLTSKEYWSRYNQILSPEGRVIFKTDNRDLFDFSLEQVEEAGWQLDNVTFDLHHSEYLEGNVMTEYEERFTAKGNPICRLVAVRDPAKALYIEENRPVKKDEA
ncbi:MAG: tRNA (guanosine(46)-N7)-methyltransferase TrmB [Coprococcus sp.]